MRGCLAFAVLAVLVPAAGRAEVWTPSSCGPEPEAHDYDLSSRAAYNASVKQANDDQQAARAYSSCVLRQAHDDETAISRAAQDRIAQIQTIAVARQQAIYARLQANADRFRAAAAKLAGAGTPEGQ
jgi:hypothetical protein